jgi:hypothetical protein
VPEAAPPANTFTLTVAASPVASPAAPLNVGVLSSAEPCVTPSVTAGGTSSL